MLIDQLLGDSILAKAGYLTADLRGRLAKAPKFVLRRDFAMAADALSGSLDDLNKALPFCRLPYPECWIEVAQGDRRSFAESPIALETDSPIKRVGFLLTQLDREGFFLGAYVLVVSAVGAHVWDTAAAQSGVVDDEICCGQGRH